MHTRKHKKYIIEDKYVAEVEIELVDTEEGWSPYISLDDALKLDRIRELLQKNDIASAKKLAKVFTLTPIAA